LPGVFTAASDTGSHILNKFLVYFQAGFLPSLATTYTSQIQLLDLLAQVDDPITQAFVIGERQRFEDDGHAEAAYLQVVRARETALSLGVTLVDPADLGQGMFDWANGATEALRRPLNANNLAHQPFLMVHAAGNNAGEVVALMNVLMFTLSFLMVTPRPELVAQWEQTTKELRRLAQKTVETFAYSGIPKVLEGMGGAIDRAVADIVRYPLRPDDGFYLSLLGKHIQYEHFALLDALEFAEEAFDVANRAANGGGALFQKRPSV
jgi:hypothetical protein